MTLEPPSEKQRRRLFQATRGAFPHLQNASEESLVVVLTPIFLKELGLKWKELDRYNISDLIDQIEEREAIQKWDALTRKGEEQRAQQNRGELGMAGSTGD